MTYDNSANVSHLVDIARKCEQLDPGLYAQGADWYNSAWPQNILPTLPTKLRAW